LGVNGYIVKWGEFPQVSEAVKTMTSTQPLHALILQDSPEDAELLVSELRRAGFAVEWRRVDSEADYTSQLSPTIDVIFADYELRQFDALRALEILRQKRFEIPFIIVSGSIGEDLAGRVAERTAELARTNQSLLEQIAERNAANERIQEHEAQLRSLSRRLVEAQESERRQLSSELHDRIGQNCAALKLNLGIVLSELPDAIKPKLGPRLYDSLQLIDATVRSIEDIMVELRPPMLDDHGLLAALRWIGAQLSRRTGIAATVEGPEDLDRLASAIEIGLCRIVQEALNNVAKHARARHVTITVSVEGGKLGLVVSDDGTGFDPEAVLRRPDPGRWGLITMRERAQACGGTLTIDSAPGKGTRIIVAIAR
jgi:signal transduction histidine kinase